MTRLFLLAWLPLALAGTGEAKQCVHNQVNENYSGGWRVRTLDAFEVEDDDTRYLLVSLGSSLDYKFTACSDIRAEAIRIVVYDDMGNLVASTQPGESEDRVEGRSAELEFSPKRTADYFVGVRLLGTTAPTTEQDDRRRRRRRNEPEETTPIAGIGLGILYK